MSIHATYTGHHTNPVVIRSIFRDDDGPVGRDLDTSARRVLNRSRTLVGVNTGRLISSGRIESGQGPGGPFRDVVYGVPGITTYVMEHHDGTPPHPIRARRRKFLRFISGGQVVFRRQVRHPGTKATKFLSRALQELR